MKYLWTISLILGLLTFSIASDIYTKDFSDPKYPGKCAINSDLIVPPGRHIHPQVQCQTIVCRSDGTADIITSHPAGCTAFYHHLDQS